VCVVALELLLSNLSGFLKPAIRTKVQTNIANSNKYFEIDDL
jgi:hypothetical protein